MNSLLRDWRHQLSWGRACAMVSLLMAVAREFQGASLKHVALWLGVATGSYGTSKATEIVALLKGVGAAAPTPQGGGTSTVQQAALGSASEDQS